MASGDLNCASSTSLATSKDSSCLSMEHNGPLPVTHTHLPLCTACRFSNDASKTPSPHPADFGNASRKGPLNDRSSSDQSSLDANDSSPRAKLPDAKSANDMLVAKYSRPALL